MKYLYSTGSTETSWLFNNNRQSSNFTALYSCFDLTDFISLSGSLNIFVWGEVSILWHAENTSSITKNIILCFLPGGICCQTDEFKRLRNLSATKIFSVSISPTTSPSKVSSSHYDLLKVNGSAKSLCESLYAQVRTLLDFACLWSCVLVYQHVPCLWHIDCRCYAGKWGWISMKKEEQKTIHKQWEWQKEWKIHKMSYISVWDRRRDLFKLSESSFLSDACIQCFPPPLWIPNDPCTKYSSLDRVLVWAVFPSETEQCWKEACFALGVHCCVF